MSSQLKSYALGMTLSAFWTIQSASRPYEVEFFAEFVEEMTALFNERGYNGVILGWPTTSRNKRLLPDILLITDQVCVIIDLKQAANDDEVVTLPDAQGWDTMPWTVSSRQLSTKPGGFRTVLAGGSVNPFFQLKKQVMGLRDVIPEVSPKEVNIKTCVLLMSDPTVEGIIPGSWNQAFKITSRSVYTTALDQLLNTRSATKPIDFKSIVNRFEVVEYVPVKNQARVNQAELAKLHQIVENQTLELRRTQAEIVELHALSATHSAQQPRVQERIEDLSRKEAALLEKLKIDADRFKFAKSAENEKIKFQKDLLLAEAEKIKAETEKMRHENSSKNKSMRNAVITVGAAFLTLAIGIGLYVSSLTPNPTATSAATPSSKPSSAISQPTESCVSLSSLADQSGSDACVVFTPKAVGFSGGDAYLNDIEGDYTKGKFFVHIPDYSALGLSKTEIEEWVGLSMRVSGKLVESSDGRLKISISNLSQLE